MKGRRMITCRRMTARSFALAILAGLAAFLGGDGAVLENGALVGSAKGSCRRGRVRVRAGGRQLRPGRDPLLLTEAPCGVQPCGASVHSPLKII
jgi:hypothetical protein